MSETFFALMEVDMRSAQNCLRFLRALKAEDLPYEKVQFALNRAPGALDMNGKARAKRLAEYLVEQQLPTAAGPCIPAARLRSAAA